MKNFLIIPIRLLVCIIVFFITSDSFAQISIVNKEIEDEKKLGTNFVKIPHPLKLRKTENSFREVFHNLDEVSFLDYEKPLISSLSRGISITIPTLNRELTLELIEVSDSFYDYSVKTSDGLQTKSNIKNRHYRGVVSGDKNSVVSLSFLENEIMGIISTSEGNFNLVYDSESKIHFLYNHKNLVKKNDFKCTTRGYGDVLYEKQMLLDKAITMDYPLSTEGKCVHVYFETEVDIFSNRGSVGAVESLIAGIFNQVSTLYFNEGINVMISEIFVWTTADPYTDGEPGSGTDIEDLLNQFGAFRTSFDGDIGQLLTFRNIGGGIAWVNGLCDPNIDQRLSVSGISAFSNPVPIYSETVEIITHELGHLLGSRHTHDCVWNGNNTAIDGCDTPVGGCPTPAIPVEGGTIMSYCHLTWAGINFNNGFGLQPGNAIRDKVATASCLCTCCPYITGADLICSTETYTAHNIPTGATVTWATSEPSILTINSSTGVATATGPYARGKVVISATYPGNYGSLVRVRRTVWVGSPDFSLTIGGDETIMKYVSPGEFTNANAATITPGATTYTYTDFTGSGDMSISLSSVGGSGSYSYISVSPFSTSGHREVIIAGTNACGTFNKTMYLYLSTGLMKVYPNPASTELIVEFGTTINNLPESISLLSENSSLPVKTIDLKTINKKDDMFKGNNLKIDVSQFPRGVYYLHVVGVNGDTEKIRILLQ